MIGILGYTRDSGYNNMDIGVKKGTGHIKGIEGIIGTLGHNRDILA